MHPDQILIGGTTAVMCAVGLWKQGWLLEHTRKGRWLLNACGGAVGPWVLRGLLALGLGFGVLLAAGVINPVQHANPSAGRNP